jgi:hypothetical protein
MNSSFFPNKKNRSIFLSAIMMITTSIILSSCTQNNPVSGTEVLSDNNKTAAVTQFAKSIRPTTIYENWNLNYYGSLYSNEYCEVFHSSNGMSYIRCNTLSGTFKYGYVYSSELSNVSGCYWGFSSYSQTVYNNTSQLGKIGSVNADERIMILSSTEHPSTHDRYYCIQYQIKGGIKEGWIKYVR